MKLLSTLIFLVLAHLCSAHTDTSKTSYTKDNYRIQYPSSWRLDTSGMLGTKFFVFAPLENQNDKFSENFSLIIQDISGQNITLEKYKEISDKQINDFVTDPTIFESIIEKTSTKEYFRMSYAMTQGKFKLRVTSICHIKDEKAYLLTFSSLLDEHDRHKQMGDDMLSSFSFSK